MDFKKYWTEIKKDPDLWDRVRAELEATSCPDCGGKDFDVECVEHQISSGFYVSEENDFDSWDIHSSFVSAVRVFCGNEDCKREKFIKEIK